MLIKPLINMKLQLLASDGNDDNNDTLEEKVIKLQEQLVQMNDIIEKNKQLEQLNNQLFTKNQEYYLKITNPNTSQTTTSDEINEYEEYVGTDFYKSLSTKEKKLLETILEGED
ncbi:MAG: hypothetical protein ACRCXT_21105 [Paraclostridium sp.]